MTDVERRVVRVHT